MRRDRRRDLTSRSLTQFSRCRTPLAWRRVSINAWILACCIFIEALLTISREPDGRNELLWLQAVGPQRVAGIDHVDILIARSAAPAHRAHKQLDDVDLATLLGVVAPATLDEFGWRSAGGPWAQDGTDLAGGHQLALGNLQVQRLVEALAVDPSTHLYRRRPGQRHHART